LTEIGDMLRHEAEFYKVLFGKETKENIRIEEEFWEEDEKVTQEENDMLEASFSEAEIKNAIDDSYVEGLLTQMDSPSRSTKYSVL
jgi:rubrerythrin